MMSQRLLGQGALLHPLLLLLQSLPVLLHPDLPHASDHGDVSARQDVPPPPEAHVTPGEEDEEEVKQSR